MSGVERSRSRGSETDRQMTNAEQDEPRRDSPPDELPSPSPTSKRKAASPGVAEEDIASKRVKLDDDVPSRVNAKSNGDGGAENSGDQKLDGDSHGEADLASEVSWDRKKKEPRRPSVSEPDRRKHPSQEDRKRGQRLFGGLLSTLSQTTANSHQKKRLEIERRQQERAHQQKAEDEQRRVERLTKLNRVREIEQVDFDEHVMHARHKNLTSLAHSLHTKSKPKLYYRPWDLTEQQEAIIKRQVQEAGEAVEQQVEAFGRSKERRLRDLGVSVAPSQSDSNVGEPTLEPSNPPQAAPTSQPTTSRYGNEKDHDELVENEEDTLIY